MFLSESKNTRDPQNLQCFYRQQLNSVPRGWALKARKCSRFTEQEKNFLLELFLVGEETGRKVTPPGASRRIRTLCQEGINQRLFDKE